MSLVVSSLVAISADVGGAAEQAPAWNDKPVVATMQVAPLSRVQRDLAFLAAGAGQESTKDLHEALTELAAALDATRPAGMAVVNDEAFVPLIFLPLKDEDRVFTFLRKRLGWEFYRGDDGLYRGSGVNAVARASGPWLYFTKSDFRDRLTSLPDDPTELFAESDPGILAQLNVAADRIPSAMRGTFADFVGGWFGGTDDEGGIISSIAGHALRHFVTDAQSWQVELQCFRPLEQFHVTMHITAATGSELERWISIAESRPLVMEHLAASDAAAAAVVSAVVEGDGLELLKQNWQAIEGAARAKLPAARSNDAAQRRLAQLGTTALDAVSTAVDRGDFNLGLAVERKGAETVVLAGSTLEGSRKIEEAGIGLLDLLTQSPEFQALQWATGGNGDVTMHDFQVPADANTRPWFGEAVHLTAGFGADRFYAAMGGASALETLSAAIDRSREDESSQGTVLRLSSHMAPLMALLDQAPSSDEAANSNVHEYAELISHYRKNDVLDFTVTAAERALEGRLRIDMGVVRMLASAVPKADVPPDAATTSTPTSPPAGGALLALRPAIGAAFQIRFDSESEVTATVDGTERVDHGLYSMLYNFRVLEIRPDAAVRLEAVLKRATIKKTGADGDSFFDSDSKGDPEKMTPETVLYAAMVGEPFQMTVTADGALVEFDGLAAAVDRMVDDKLQPPANERAQAKAFVEQSFNADGLRDAVARAFEFYPGKPAAVGDRWSRTAENFSGINFLLDNKYQLKSLTAEEAVIAVRAQIREKESDPAAPVRWDVLGTQTGVVKLDPRDGRLLSAEYVLKFDAEATITMDGKTVVRPVASTIKMTIGPPAAAESNEALGTKSERTYWRHGTGHFSDHGSGAWVERSQNGVFELQEVERTPEYVELVSKSGTGTRVRLYAGRSSILRRGQASWGLQYEGDWAAPESAAQRTFWRHSQGFFDNVAAGRWLERSANGAFHFEEAARTDDYVELRNTQSGTLARLFADRCELKGSRQSEFATRYQGRWDVR